MKIIRTVMIPRKLSRQKMVKNAAPAVRNFLDRQYTNVIVENLEFNIKIDRVIRSNYECEHLLEDISTEYLNPVIILTSSPRIKFNLVCLLVISFIFIYMP